MNRERNWTEIEYADWNSNIKVSCLANQALACTHGEGPYGIRGHLLLASLIGPDSAVRAILSALISGKNVTVEGIEGSLWGGEGKSFVARPAGRLTHGYYVAAPLLPGAEEPAAPIVIVDPTPERIHRRLRRRWILPALIEWMDWLCERLAEEDCLVRLAGVGVSGIAIQTDEETVDRLLSEGVSRGQIEL